jgi:parvulin-like peptidyl-prolyl isomerase
VAPEGAAAHGDPFLLPAALPLWSEDALAARLGPEFARAALRAPPGRWSGPVASSYGLHALWVHEREPARLPGLEELRPELEASWRSEQESRALAAALAELRERTDVQVDWAPAPQS